MAKVLVLGAGVSGHTSATFLRKWLTKEHTVTVVSPNSNWNWIPSNIWVGVGKMKSDAVKFALAPVYKKAGIEFIQAKATQIWPEGDSTHEKGFVTVENTDGSETSQTIEYDYLINATGPKLNFDKTQGLGPENGFTASVCTYSHADAANKELHEKIALMKEGREQIFVVGTGHGMCTCQGAAFEYLFNIEYLLREEGVRDKARLIWLSNEYEMGDFGMGGMHLKRGGYVTNAKVFTESLMAERDIEWIARAHVNKIEEHCIHYELLDGTQQSIDYDFAMLIPPFSGVGLKAFDQAGAEMTDELFAPNGFMRVDADYSAKPFEQWQASDWPKHYQNPLYSNIFAAGIAFAPPHPISKPMKSENGTPISPTPPRTGMPSGIIGKAVATSIYNLIMQKQQPLKAASMAHMGAACVASTGMGFFKGSAAAMTVYPVVPDFETYPEYGRDTELTFGEIGLAGHWIKHILHYLFLYKAKLKFGWSLIPE